MGDDVHNQLYRTREELQSAVASLEALRRHVYLQDDADEKLRQAHTEKQNFLVRAAALEDRAERVERLAEDLAAEVVHRAEMVDWKRQRRRQRWAVMVGAIIALMLLAVILVVHIHDDRQIDQRVAQTKQAFCAFLVTRANVTDTASDKALAAEAAKLSHGFGCG